MFTMIGLKKRKKEKKKERRGIVKIVTSYVCFRCSLKSHFLFFFFKTKKNDNYRMINRMCVANRVEK